MDFFFRLFDFRRLAKPASPGARAFVGYGPVNYWHNQNMRTWTALHAKHGVPCVHIEFFGWASGAVYSNPDAVRDAWEGLCFWCRRRRLTLFVSVTNDNKGSGKYGDDRAGLATFRPQISKALGWVKAEFWEGLYIQPVGETQTPAGGQIEAEAAAMFPVAHLVRNTGSRPSSGGGWAAHFAYHAARTSDRVPAPAWAVTDHSTIIGEFGGLYAERYAPDRCAAYARRMLAQESPCIIYGFAHRKPDADLMEALGKATS